MRCMRRGRQSTSAWTRAALIATAVAVTVAGWVAPASARDVPARVLAAAAAATDREQSYRMSVRVGIDLGSSKLAMQGDGVAARAPTRASLTMSTDALGIS